MQMFSTVIGPTPRRRAVRLGCAAAALVLLAAGCSDDDADTDPSATTTAAPAEAIDDGAEVERFADPDGPVEVSVGQQFQITLEADVAECYSWSLDTDFDTDVLTFVTSDPAFQPGPDEPDLTPVSDTDIFTFTAADAGEVTLTFTEVSPCPDSPDRDATTIDVIVEQ